MRGSVIRSECHAQRLSHSLLTQVKRELSHAVEKMFHQLEEAAKDRVQTLNGEEILT